MRASYLMGVVYLSTRPSFSSISNPSYWFYFISLFRRGFSSSLVSHHAKQLLMCDDFVEKPKILWPRATETTSACTHREAQIALSLFKTVNYRKGHLQLSIKPLALSSEKHKLPKALIRTRFKRLVVLFA